MSLTDLTVRNAKPNSRLQKLSDGRGLQLHITTAGSKLWRWAYRYDSKQKLMALGIYPDVSLAQARQAADEARKLLASGIDPMEQRKADKNNPEKTVENTFEIIARQWWQHWSPARSARHAEYVIRRLEADVFPLLGGRPVNEIQAPEVVKMIKTIEERGALDIAKRSLQTCGQIFRYAIAHGYAIRNPATDIRPGDVLTTRKKQNYARVDAKELPGLLRHIEVYQGSSVTRLAMKLMAMTFVRTSELISARWEEFDLDTARWDIPAERMKMKMPHVVLLSRQAVQLLRTLHTLTGHRELLFPGERKHQKPMSNNTILKALERMGYKGRMTGHGFRGIASTVLHEHGWPHEHIEMQLAHQERDDTSAAYNHAQYLKQRAEMMQWWSDYLEKCNAEEPVSKLMRKVA
ncbi:tyrosine-type recombinase/integrase [Alcaligenes sp. DN25]|uniref:tyrosine-type recombinase/integrase n=1 Tax=Alcaligenes TaxID=507 RepID=UPI00202E924F|nr:MULTISPECIES: integrase arm-type DNA-binding domain-containing protein [Alcaligenes]URW82168.1 tyrosine-type recombinase/integrase [Alcaligenes sp. DN25]WEA66989.1 tyrosine-type recombinase/integrase [Alcaligenes faecalis]